MFVYTMVYSTEKNFLLFTKPLKGYFFSKNGKGSLVKKGQPLHGGGFNAFPGGTAESSDIKEEGQREFVEECGRLIDFVDDDRVTLSPLSDDEDDIIVYIERSFVRKFKNDPYGYSALYIQLSDDDLRTVGHYLDTLSIPDGVRAVKDIIRGEITSYTEIGERYPYAPWDNELDSVALWNYDTDLKEIKKLAKNRNTDWFYNIITLNPWDLEVAEC